MNAPLFLSLSLPPPKTGDLLPWKKKKNHDTAGKQSNDFAIPVANSFIQYRGIVTRFGGREFLPFSLSLSNRLIVVERTLLSTEGNF